MFTMYVLVLVLVGGCFGQGGMPEVEYVLNFDSPVYVCPDDISSKFVDTSKIDLKQVDGAAVLSGTINFLQGLDQNTMLELEVKKEMSGRFETIFSHEICDLCGEIQNKESEYKDYLKYFGFPEQCPFDPEEYHIHDFTADTSDFPVNGQNAGSYQAHTMMYKTNGDCQTADKTLLACMMLDFVVEPGK